MPEAVPNSFVSDITKELSEIKASLNQPTRLKDGDGGGTFSGMEERVAKLETHFEYVRKDLDEIKADQKTIIAALTALPTKKDLDSWRWQWLATGVAILALTVGGITGGLALIAKFAN